MTDRKSNHCVAIVGGATAGAEVASRLSDRGIQVAVFEQNSRPFGKIEDGLPRWHEALRKKEYETIRKKLSLPRVDYVPNTKIGREIEFETLVNEWGFTSVILANGAWWDRPLPVEGADDYLNKGLIYQNPFVIAFNHAEDPAWSGEQPDVIDDSIVVGGGLASIDVAKIVTLTCTQRAMAERDIRVGINQLEVKGIPKTLQKHGLTWEELGLAGCTIYYRRRIEDMPLVSIPEDATEERIAKIKKSRQTMLNKAAEKFKLRVEPLSAPDGLLTRDGTVVGLRFRRTQIEDGRVVAMDQTYERRGPVVISSIGSIPEPIKGIDMKGELFDFADWNYGLLTRYPTVFSVGNVVTGKGNIVASRKHATRVSQEAIEVYLGIADGDQTAEAPPSPETEAAGQFAESVGQQLQEQPSMSDQEYAALMERIAARQHAVGYPGDLATWLENVPEPP